MISATVTVTPPNLASALANIPNTVIDAEFRRMMLEAEALAKQYATGGNPLHVRTGRLRSAMNQRVLTVADGWRGILGNSVVYARIHELGGVIPAHQVRPVRASVLRFVINGQVVFAKYANIPAITMPARPTLQPAVVLAAEHFVQRIARMDLVQESSKKKP